MSKEVDFGVLDYGETAACVVDGNVEFRTHDGTMTLNWAQCQAAVDVLHALVVQMESYEQREDVDGSDVRHDCRIAFNYGKTECRDTATGKVWEDHDRVTGQVRWDDGAIVHLWTQHDEVEIGDIHGALEQLRGQLSAL